MIAVVVVGCVCTFGGEEDNKFWDSARFVALELDLGHRLFSPD
jgi:hypothetical protein